MDSGDEAFPGWWCASDGRWYRPEDLPNGGQLGAASTTPHGSRRAHHPTAVDECARIVAEPTLA